MPNIKRIVQIILLVIVVGSVSYLIAKEILYKQKEKRGAAVVEQTVPNTKPDHVVAYYFHGNFRCVKCRKIEVYSKESIEANFSNELKNGLLLFKVINVEEPENRHFIQDYGLYTKSLVVVSYAKDKQIKFKNLEGVWDHLDSKSEFENYVSGEIKKYLSEVGQ